MLTKKKSRDSMDNRGRRSDSRNALVCVMEVMVDLPLSLNALVVHLKPPINITCL